MARRRVALVTGGAGFVGSHLSERLLAEGCEVVCVDSFITGSPQNVSHLGGRFFLLERDVRRPIRIPGRVDEVYHLASPASPKSFGPLAIEILESGSAGTRTVLELARSKNARFLLASTSEVYGDPLVHPQPEDYRGNVSTTGVRGAYDEAKRYAEALTSAYRRRHRLQTRIARIFNTYGPRMRPDDGRLVPNLVRQALAGEPLTVYGDGTQTRSLQYVDDLVEGLLLLMRSDEARPVNLGNPEERSVLEIAELVSRLAGGEGRIVHLPPPEDDPRRRSPDISRARASLGWEPVVDLEEGLARTIRWFAAGAGARKRAAR